MGVHCKISTKRICHDSSFKKQMKENGHLRMFLFKIQPRYKPFPVNLNGPIQQEFPKWNHWKWAKHQAFLCHGVQSFFDIFLMFFFKHQAFLCHGVQRFFDVLF